MMPFEWVLGIRDQDLDVQREKESMVHYDKEGVD
jgi:hypothetical protein